MQLSNAAPAQNPLAQLLTLLGEADWRKLHQGESLKQDLDLSGMTAHPVWLDVTFTPIMDVNGRLSKVVMYGSDISLRKLTIVDCSPP